MKSKVVLVRCESYDDEAVRAAVARGLDLLGGPGRFAREGERILLKPNLLVAAAPEKAVTTHPAVFRAVAEAFQKTGASLCYGDSPSFGSLGRVARKAGLAEVADALGVELADFQDGEEVFFKEGRQNRRFRIARGVLASDGVISLPKLKTHGLERMTGCVKNQFGCIPGLLKGEFHVRLPDANDFGRMLVDLNRLVGPRLYVMDGIVGMEGNGPQGGTPVSMNVLLFSEDPVALDATVCRLVGLDPARMPTIPLGSEAGAGVYREEEIELAGDPLDPLRNDRFQVEREPVKPYRTTGRFRFVSNRLVSRPFVVEEKCVRCGACVTLCPVTPKAVDWIGGDRTRPPRHDYGRCIRCYCCQEVCPEGAIELRVPLGRRIYGLVTGR